MEENQSNKKIKIAYIILSVLIVISIVEFVILLPSKELSKQTNQSPSEEIKLGDNTILLDSEDVQYDNTTSGLTSTTVQDAIDELNTATNTCVTNLTTAQANTVTYKEEICPGCVYRKSTTSKYNSNASGADGTNNKLSSSEYTTDYTTLSNYFLGHVIDGSGYILASYACGINNGTFFCLRGVDSDQSSLTYKPFYQEGVNMMNKAFPGCNANTSGSYAECSGSGGVGARVNSNGLVRVNGGAGTVGDGFGDCYVFSAGASYCF